MATTPFFPPVNDRGRMAATVYGEWEPINERDFLLKLAKGLTLHTPETTNLLNVRALPDVWGQLVAFQSAWEDTQHPLTRGAVAEWRGVLALLGLTDWRKSPLHRVEVRLPELIDYPFIKGAPANNEVPNLARVIEAFMPQHEREPVANWEHMSVLLHGRRLEEAQTIALMTPSTLIVPSRTYTLDVEATGIPWVGRGGYPLLDPTPFLTNPRERQALSNYLSQLHDAVSHWDLSRQQRRRVLVTRTLGQLEAFIRDLQAPEMREEFTYSETLLGALPPWHRLAPLCSVPKRSSQSGSDTKLLVRGELRSGPTVGVVLYGGALDCTDRGSFSVWGDHLLDELQSDRHPSFGEVVRDAERAGFPMLDAAKLLADTLMQVDGDDAGTTIGDHPGEWSRFLLPIAPQVLAFMPIDEVVRNLTLEPTRNGYAVTLKVKLTRRDGSTVDAKVRREYGAHLRNLITVDLPAALELWPNFQAEDWQHHYIDTVDYPVEGGTVRRYAQVAGALSPRGISEALAASRAGDLLNALEQGLDDNRQYCQKLLTPPRGETTRTLRLMARAPEALVLDAGGGQRGLIALAWKRPEAVPGEWKASVDFGASGTFILVKAPGNAEPLNPQPRQWWREVLSRRLRAPQASAMSELPQDEIVWPTLSMLYDPMAMKHGAPGDHLQIFERVTPATGSAEELLWKQLASRDAKQPSLLFGLKYGQQIGHGTNFTAATRLFLKAMLLGAAAEVVGSGGRLDAICWRAAHPASMFDSEIAALRQSLAMSIAAVEGSPLAPPAPQPALMSRLEPFTENRAVTEYLTVVCGTNAQRLSIVMDIGGFSTDISIWNMGRLLWTGSLALAGHDLINDYFAADPFRIDQLVSNESSKLKNALGVAGGSGKNGINDTALRGVVEISLRQPAVRDRLAGLLPATAGVNGLERLQNVIRFAHAAYLKYLSLVIAELEVLDDLARGVNLFYGGRGGQLIKSFLGEQIVSRDTQTCLGAGRPIHSVSMFVSPAPKEEVARGLLLINPKIEQTPAAILPMGEEFHVRQDDGSIVGRSASDASFVSEVDRIERTVHLQEYRRLAADFAIAFPEPAQIGNTSAFRPAVETAFDQELERARAARGMAHQAAENRDAPVQPLFILAVRTAIRQWHSLP